MKRNKKIEPEEKKKSSLFLSRKKSFSRGKELLQKKTTGDA